MRPLIPRGASLPYSTAAPSPQYACPLNQPFQQHERTARVTRRYASASHSHECRRHITQFIRREVPALLRLISNAVLAAITEWRDGVSRLRNGRFLAIRSGDVETTVLEQSLGFSTAYSATQVVHWRTQVQTQGRRFFLQHQLLRQCNGATKPHYPTVHTNVDALEYAKAEFILQRVVTCLLIQPFVLKAITSKGLSRLLIFLTTAGGDLTCTFPKSLPGASFSMNDKDSTSPTAPNMATLRG